MGIRFLCPSGHKLNVKSFLAGKRGICPHCGAKFEIPFESVATPPKSPPQRAAGGLPQIALPGVPVTSTAVGQAAAPVVTPLLASQVQPTPTPVTASANASSAPDAAGPGAVSPAASGIGRAPASSGIGGGAAPAAGEAAAPLQSVPPVPPAPSVPAMPDPIAEAPSAVWYVRTNAGGQFGPARGDMMRQWLDERRVGPDYLVWREGWAEWKRASAVFARLAAMSAAGKGAAPVAAAPRMDDDWVEAIIESQSHPTHHHKPKPKSPNNNLLMAISFAVVLLGVILVIVVIIAAKKQAKKDTPENSGAGSGTSWIAPREPAAASLCRIDRLECGRPSS